MDEYEVASANDNATASSTGGDCVNADAGASAHAHEGDGADDASMVTCIVMVRSDGDAADWDEDGVLACRN